MIVGGAAEGFGQEGGTAVVTEDFESILTKAEVDQAIRLARPGVAVAEPEAIRAGPPAQGVGSGPSIDEVRQLGADDLVPGRGADEIVVAAFVAESLVLCESSISKINVIFGIRSLVLPPSIGWGRGEDDTTTST